MNTTNPEVPEPVAKAVERIIDEHSAWVAMPNREVAEKIALAAVIAAHTIISKENVGDRQTAPISVEQLEEIETRAKAAQKVAPGPWEVSSEKQDDTPYRHLEFALLDANGNRFAGTENSDTTWGLLEEDSPDEYGFSAMWNEPARIVTEFIRFCDPLTTLALVERIRKLTADLERIRSAEPDWFWCDIDPDENGDSAYEAMFHHRSRLVPVELSSSYTGPKLWGVMAPPLPDADDDSETAHTFDTREEAEAFCAERKQLSDELHQPVVPE